MNQKQSEKMSRYLIQKKEELAQVTQQKGAMNAGKKGFLLANIKISKASNSRGGAATTLNTQQNQQDTFDRMHIPTEEDDYCGSSRANDFFNDENSTFQLATLATQ